MLKKARYVIVLFAVIREMSIPDFVLKQAIPLVDTNGSRWIVTGIKKRKEKETIEFFKKRMKIDAGFVTEPDGIYIWIIKGGHLVTMPVKSVQEVGSVHVNIWSWTPEFGTLPSDVSSAGELIKKGDSVEFNFKSGTFMIHILKHASIADIFALTANVSATFASVGITATFLKCNNRIYGKTIVGNTAIVTSDLEMAFLTQLFKMHQILRCPFLTDYMRY